MMQIVSELVSGELMQLDGTANKEEWFDHYLEKTFKKTASLIANGCQAVRHSSTSLKKNNML
jgi:decaprenyl-diphosphate synthase subunit 1